MAYVDGFVLPVPKKSLAAYRAIAKMASNIWIEYGALEYRECWGDDLKTKMGIPFTKLAKTKPSETVVFAWIVYKSRASRNSINAKVMKDPRLANMDPKKMPFDCKRMTYGGFKIIVEKMAGAKKAKASAKKKSKPRRATAKDKAATIADNTVALGVVGNTP